MTPYLHWRTVGQALRWTRTTTTRHTRSQAAGGRRIHTWRIDDNTAVDITLIPGEPEVRVDAHSDLSVLAYTTGDAGRILAVLAAAGILPDQYAPDGGREAAAARLVLELAEDLEGIRIVTAAGKAVRP